ncbi:MAG TPA: diacylglycerol kinase family protein [Bdellovibrionales bacterium]|nr:diacylglycerol kinase family protein [Bdellovibrionales bacterium]
MNRLAVVVNPWARGGRGLSDWLGEARPALEARLALLGGTTWLECYVPHEKSEAKSARAELAYWIQSRIQDGERRFLAAGGDGTVNLVLNLIFESARRLGIPTSEFTLGALGLGSSNDFHKSLSAPAPKLAGRFCARLDFAGAAASDVGEFENAQGGHTRFAINLSVGLTAAANDRFNNPGPLLAFLKKTSTEAAIAGAAVHTALNYRNVPMKVTWNGRSVQCDVVNMSLIKKNHFAGSFYYQEAPAPDDGRLGLYIFSGLSKLQTLAQMANLTRGRFKGQVQDFTSEVALESRAPFLVEADGEVHELTRTRVIVRQKGIRLCR